MGLVEYLAVFKKHGRVVNGLAVRKRVFVCKPTNNTDPSDTLNQFVKIVQICGNKCLFLKQIPWRIPGDNQFRKHDKIAGKLLCLVNELYYLLRVLFKIRNRRIDLS